MKILYISPWSYYKKKIARHRFQTMEAISNLAEVVWSGPGWDNYRTSLTVSQNIAHMYRGATPDLVVAFPTPQPIKGLPDLGLKKCFRYDEMHTHDGHLAPLEEIPKNRIDWVVCHYENEMRHPAFQTLKGVTMSHLPMCAEPSIFRDYKLEKTTDVLLIGSTNDKLYPLRKRLAEILEIISSRTKLICRVHSQPNQPDLSSGRHQIDFARAINSSKIALTCSSKYRYALGKYVEVPMSGTVLMGDLPYEREKEFASFMLVIEEQDSDETIIKKIVSCLSDENRQSYMVSRGIEFAATLTTHNYAQRFMGLAEKLLSRETQGDR